MTGAEIRAAREEMGLTQAELAKALGYSGGRKVQDIEAGRRNMGGPPTVLLRKLLDEHRAEERAG